HARETPPLDQTKGSGGGRVPGMLDHARRDIDASGVKPEPLEKTCGASRSAAEVERYRPGHVPRDDFRQIAESEPVGSWELERRVRIGTPCIVIDVQERQTGPPSAGHRQPDPAS